MLLHPRINHLKRRLFTQRRWLLASLWLTLGAAVFAAPPQQNSEPAPEATPVELAWGTVNNGLQAALVIEPPQSAYHIGDTVTCDFVVRNTKTIPCILGYTEPLTYRQMTEVMDASDQYVPVYMAIHPLAGLPATRLLGGETSFTLERLSFRLQAPGWEGKLPETTILAEPGQYRIRHSVFIYPANYMGPSWSGQLTTGDLNFSIEADAAQAASTPGAFPENLSPVYAEEVVHILSQYQSQPTYLTAQPILQLASDYRINTALKAECRLLDDEAIDYLGHLALVFPEISYRKAAIMALGNTSGPHAVEVLKKIRNGPNALLQGDAARALDALQAAPAN